MHFECPICSVQGKFWRELGRIYITKCGHIFHLNCLTIHISSQPKLIFECPFSICNKKIKQSTITQIDLAALDIDGKNHQHNQPVVCSLCEDPVTDPQNISITKCGHIYHFVCLTTLVKPKSNTCLVSSCKIRLTQASIIQLHFGLDIGDGTSPIDVTPADITLDNDVAPHTDITPLNVVTPPDDITLFNDVTPHTDIKPSNDVTSSSDTSQINELRISEDKQNPCPKNKKENKQECKSQINIWDRNEVKNVDITQNQEIVKLKKQYKMLEEQKNSIEKERNDAKKETAIWEMCFKYLQEQAKDTDLMIPDEKILEIMRENEKLKTIIQDMDKDGVIMNKRMNGAVPLKTDFERLTNENRILKRRNDAMESDLKKLKEEMKKFNPMINELVINHSLENNTLKELNASLLNENSNLVELNTTLQQECNNLKKVNNVLLTINTTLTNLDETERREQKYVNEILQNEKTKLIELNESLRREHASLYEDNKNLRRENNNLQGVNGILQIEKNNLNEQKDFFRTESERLNELVVSINKKQYDLQWDLINRRSSFSNGNQDMSKTSFSEMIDGGIEIQEGIDVADDEMVKAELLNEEVASNKDNAKEEDENKDEVNENVENKEHKIEVLENKVVENKDVVKEVENKDVAKKEMEIGEPKNKRAKLGNETNDVPLPSRTG